MSSVLGYGSGYCKAKGSETTDHRMYDGLEQQQDGNGKFFNSLEV